MKRTSHLLVAFGLLAVLVVPRDSGAAVCSMGGTASGTCGQVPENVEGCCTTAGESVYCENGVLCVLDCPSNATKNACGWNATSSAYDCVETMGFADPTCTFPMMCPADCEPCGAVTEPGCCDGAIVTWCECGCLRTIDCSGNPAGSRTCGWDSEYGNYDCGQSGSDPSGVNPKACGTTCTPDCSGKECGSDGCGGSCGSCGASQKCTANQCVTSCTPACTTRECGPDGCGGSCGSCAYDEVCDGYGWCCTPMCGSWAECGDDTCGGSCGTCPSGETCEVGECVSGQCTPNCFGRECGDDGCGGSCGTCPSGETCSTWSGVCSGGGSCTPDCYGVDCGDDGCGGSCGSCLSGQDCVDGTCTTGGGCVTACEGKQCGADGCGGSCGECLYGQTCQSGTCVTSPTCTKNCANRTCGDDGCGGTCGTCGADQICQAFTCIDAKPCVPLCTGKVCGPDGCGGACGACMPPEQCSDNGRCYDPKGCVPACNGRQCDGNDGCGGTCGTCRSGQQCSPDGTCADLPGNGEGDGTPSDRDASGPSSESDAVKSCPAGTVLSYGSCVAVGAEAKPGSGGCSAGLVPPVPGLAIPLMLAAMAWAGARRRRP